MRQRGHANVVLTRRAFARIFAAVVEYACERRSRIYLLYWNACREGSLGGNTVANKTLGAYNIFDVRG